MTSDGRSLTGISGDAGTGTQAFSYDNLSRLTGSTGLAVSRSYQYDLDGNRTSKVEGSMTTAYTYDRADQLATQTVTGLPLGTFDYDRYGNLLSARDATNAQTTYGYDAASRLTGITPPTGGAVSFTIDALDRPATRSVVGTGTSDTYGYVSASETAYLTGSGTTTGSLLDAEGSRLAVKTGSSVSWLVFDLHGSVAGLCPSGTAALADAYRYDGWGRQVAKSGSSTNPFRYRGLLNLGYDDLSGALLAMGAREYASQLGTFTQEDSVQGGAANPFTMNRFLYALANPATLIDPDGHMAGYVGGTATWTAPKPTGGLTTGGDCNQACIDQLNNVSGVNTYGDGGSGGGGSGKGFVPPGYEPAPDGMHWSAEPMIGGQYQLMYDSCSISAAGYYQGECINEVQMKAIEDFGLGVVEGSAQAAAFAFFCGVTAGGCALVTGLGLITTAHAVNEGGIEAALPHDAKGWGQLTGFGIFGGFGPVGRTAESGSNFGTAIRNELSPVPGRPSFGRGKEMVIQAKAPIGAAGGFRCATCTKEFGPLVQGLRRPWDIDHWLPWRWLKYLSPRIVERVAPGARKWLYNLDVNLRLRCQACNRGG